MYNYDFSKEKVIFEKLNTLVEISGRSYCYNILITNKNILLFVNVNKNNSLISRGVQLPSENELVKTIPLDKLKYKCIEEDTIINVSNDEIIIYNINIDKFLSKKMPLKSEYEKEER